MNFKSQSDAINQLNLLASCHRQSVLIEGPTGCGKSYLSRMYASLMQCIDIVTVAPKVNDVREAVDSCVSISTPIAVVIENLDCGVSSASYAILKFLEEPAPNVTVIVTCRNINNVPDTIVSRSSVVSVSHPLTCDLVKYAMSKDSSKYNSTSSNLIWKCVRSFSDVDTVLNMNSQQAKYFQDLSNYCQFNDTVSNIAWKLGHYDDNTDTPVELVIRYIMEVCTSATIRRAGISCINDINLGRFAQHAVLSKFAFNAKYLE